MVTSIFSAEIQGLKELQDSLNLNRIPKQLAINVGLAKSQLLQTIKTEVFTRYNISSNKFDSALVGQSVSSQKTGKNLILDGLQFKDTPVNLAAFVTDKFQGNIEPLPKQRQGIVHIVTVKRGNSVISYGKSRQGGFTIKKGKVMVVRTAPGRDAPLKALYAPTIVDMINMVIDYNSKVQNAFNTFTDRLLDNVRL